MRTGVAIIHRCSFLSRATTIAYQRCALFSTFSFWPAIVWVIERDQKARQIVLQSLFSRQEYTELPQTTMTAMNNLAGTLKAQEDLAGARKLQDKALEASVRLLGKEYPAETLRGTSFNCSSGKPKIIEVKIG